MYRTSSCRPRSRCLLAPQVARLNSVKKDVAVLRAIRNAVGPDIRLRVDANRGWSLRQALDFVAAIQKETKKEAPVNPEYIEEPLKENEATELAWETWAKLCNGVPLALDESLEPGALRARVYRATELGALFVNDHSAPLISTPHVQNTSCLVRVLALNAPSQLFCTFECTGAPSDHLVSHTQPFVEAQSVLKTCCPRA